MCIRDRFNDQVATGCTRDSAFNQQQVALSVNAYYVKALNGYTCLLYTSYRP